ncbi:uncharacterized protein LOC144210978 [Stigmatopora nigra]
MEMSGSNSPPIRGQQQRSTIHIHSILTAGPPQPTWIWTPIDDHQTSSELAILHARCQPSAKDACVKHASTRQRTRVQMMKSKSLLLSKKGHRNPPISPIQV